jgi:hypothetical protein
MSQGILGFKYEEEKRCQETAEAEPGDGGSRLFDYLMVDIEPDLF